MEINVYYAKLDNMGDLLNELIIPQITSREIVHCPNYMKFDVMGIGSCGGAIWANSEDSMYIAAKDLIKKASCMFTNKPCAIWGTGFSRDYSTRNIQLVRKNVSFIAVRGALSKQIIERATGKKISPVMCDGGIFAAEILKSPVEKKYNVGFIPHYKEHDLCKKMGIWSEFEDKRRDAVVINLRDNPEKVIRQIGECEYIISSSLHGCVVADSFHIPNIHIRLSSIPGTGFKFDDYYSGYGLTVPAVLVEGVNDLPTINEIIDGYRLSFDVIDEKKKAMANCLKNFIEQHEI